MNNKNDSWNESVKKTNDFYNALDGYSYTDEQVDRWLNKWFFPFVALRGNEHVLDLCCGDGVWSFGLLRKLPNLKIIAVDVSSGAIECAKQRARTNKINNIEFTSHNCEESLPLENNIFDLVFARGLFIFNQHDMMRSGCIDLLEKWHDKLKIGGRFISMYGSKPEKLGSYTKPENTKGLPTNLLARKTNSLDFEGGKFNHSPATFSAPFLSIKLAKINFYQYNSGRHTLISEKVA